MKYWVLVEKGCEPFDLTSFGSKKTTTRASGSSRSNLHNVQGEFWTSCLTNLIQKSLWLLMGHSEAQADSVVWRHSVSDLLRHLGSLPQPTFPELQLAESHPDIILWDTLIDLEINFSLDDGELSRPRGRKRALNYETHSTALEWNTFSCWRAVPLILYMKYAAIIKQCWHLYINNFEEKSFMSHHDIT